MRRRWFTTPLPVVVLLLAACSGDAGDAERATTSLEPTVSDSAGVTLLTHTADAFDRAPRITIDSAPVASIEGSAEDESADISTVTPLLFLADGRLVGRERQRQALVIFAADGSDRIEFGRQGGGPGEFGFISRVAHFSDTLLLIHDGRNARLTLFDPRTGPATEWPQLKAMEAGATSLLGVVDGKVLMTGMNMAGGEVATAGFKGVLFDLTADSARRVFTTGPAEQEADQPRIVAAGPGGGAIAVRAISIQPLQGFPSAFAWQGQFVLTNGSSMQFEMRDTTGTVTAILRIDRPRVAVTGEVWEAHISEMIARVSGAGSGSGPVVFSGGGGGSQPDTADIRRQMRGEEHADSLPAFEGTHVTPDGTLWVIDHAVPGQDGWAATAIAPDGSIRGRIVETSGDAPVAIGNDRLAFRTEDELGIATITIHRIRFPD